MRSLPRRALLLGLTSLLLWPAAAAAAGRRLLLPLVVQAAPNNLSVRAVRTSTGVFFRLGFDAAMTNLGSGPLLIEGTRSAGGMSARQLVRVAGGGVVDVPRVGVLRYTPAHGHRHWHLLDFDRYELRGVGAGAALRRDRKAGFCLGDRFLAARGLTGEPPAQSLAGRCGEGNPGLRTLREGIDVGWGDVYPAHVEGQYVELNGVPPGRYLVVARIDPQARLRLADRGAGVAWTEVDLRWPGGPGQAPTATALRSCQAPQRCESLLGAGG